MGFNAEISALIRKEKDTSTRSLCHVKATARMQPLANQEDGPHHNLTMLVPRSHISSLQSYDNINLLFKPPISRYFAMVVQANTSSIFFN